MIRKIGFILLWIGFASYAFILAPPDRADTLTLIQNLSIGNWSEINPLIVALFNLMGIWPAIYSCILFADGRWQKFPAWPFATISFGLGAFALLPYLALREPNPEFTGQKTAFLKLLDSRWTGLLLVLGTVIFLVYGLMAGDWENFAQQWQTSRFIHVMSLDFCMLSLVFPALVSDDMARRGWRDERIFWMVILIPILGAATYLILRPPIPDSSELETLEVAVSE